MNIPFLNTPNYRAAAWPLKKHILNTLPFDYIGQVSRSIPANRIDNDHGEHYGRDERIEPVALFDEIDQ